MSTTLERSTSIGPNYFGSRATLPDDSAIAKRVYALNETYFPGITIEFGGKMSSPRLRHTTNKKGQLDLILDDAFNFNSMPAKKRDSLTINGENAGYADGISFQFQILYALQGIEMPHVEGAYMPIAKRMKRFIETPLEISELAKILKPIVIRTFRVSNATSLKNVPRNDKKAKASLDILLDNNITHDQIWGNTLRTHKGIQDTLRRTPGNYERAKSEESKIILRALELCKQYCIPAIPLGDSLYGPNSKQLGDVICESFEERFGITPKLHIKPAA